MSTSQLLIILFFFAFTGWFIASVIIRFLFSPVKPFFLAGITVQGLLPASQRRLAKNAGMLVQSEFMHYKGIEEKITDPLLIAKLKPEIEKHIDHFLQEKIKTVFPLLAPFMGEKTISQFKAALLTEIDNLFPILMKQFSGDLRNEIKLDLVVEQRLNELDMNQLKTFLFVHGRKQMNRFKLASVFAGLLIGIVVISIINYI